MFSCGKTKQEQGKEKGGGIGSFHFCKTLGTDFDIVWGINDTEKKNSLSDNRSIPIQMLTY